jgi:hypothetical protein
VKQNIKPVQKPPPVKKDPKEPKAVMPKKQTN